MKKNHIFTLLLIMTSFFYSCTGMNDNVDKWLDGEIIYGAKVDSVKAFSGKNRIQLNLYVGSQRIDNILIYWNSQKDSTIVDVNNKTGVFSTILENLEEKDYLFQIYTFDQYGNRSLRTDANGSAYGSKYEEGLLSRSTNKYYTKFDPTVHTLSIYWGGLIEGATALKISYVDVEGNQQTEEIGMDTQYTKIENIASHCNILTEYQPNKMIDTFSATSNLPLYYEEEIDKSGWTIAACSSEWAANGLPVSNVIDGSVSTAWHTSVAGDQLRAQHWFIVDMGKEYNVTRFGVYGPQDPKSYTDQVYNNNYSLKYATEGDLTNTTDPNDAGWSKYGEYELVQGEQRELLARRNSLVNARYILFYMKYGNQRDGICSVAEINAYTPMSEDYIQ